MVAVGDARRSDAVLLRAPRRPRARRARTPRRRGPARHRPGTRPSNRARPPGRRRRWRGRSSGARSTAGCARRRARRCRPSPRRRGRAPWRAAIARRGAALAQRARHAAAPARPRDVRGAHAAIRIWPGRTRVNCTGLPRDFDRAPSRQADAGERRGSARSPVSREVFAKVRAARVGARLGRRRRSPRSRRSGSPGSASRARSDCSEGRRPRRRFASRRALKLAQARVARARGPRVAQDADVVPHDGVERLRGSPRGRRRPLRERPPRARLRLPRARRSRARATRLRAQSTRAIASPAIAPNTVEFATPLPPRRLAPCTPPVSSPAAKSPSIAVRQSARELDAAHHVVRGRHHFDQAARRDRSRSRRSAPPCP